MSIRKKQKSKFVPIDSLEWLIKKRIEGLRRSIRKDNKTVKMIIENTSINELKLLLKILNLAKKKLPINLRKIL